MLQTQIFFYVRFAITADTISRHGMDADNDRYYLYRTDDGCEGEKKYEVNGFKCYPFRAKKITSIEFGSLIFHRQTDSTRHYRSRRFDAYFNLLFHESQM